MKQEQSNLEKGVKAKEEFDKQLRIIIQDTYKEELLKALADQKQKYRDMLENSLKLCGYCKHQILREFEELTK